LDVIREDDKYVYFEATSPGLSAFLISGKEPQTTTTIKGWEDVERKDYYSILIVVSLIIFAVLFWIFYLRKRVQ